MKYWDTEKSYASDPHHARGEITMRVRPELGVWLGVRVRAGVRVRVKIYRLETELGWPWVRVLE